MEDEKVSSGKWECRKCTYHNNKYLSYCEKCLTPTDGQQNTRKQNNCHVAKKWQCKLCGMSNNKYIPYCEECLIKRKDQRNKKLLNELQIELKSCDPYIKADEIKGMIEKLKDDFRRLKMYQKDKQIVPEIQQQIETLYAKMNIKCETDIVQDFIETYNIDNYGFKQQRKSNKKCHPICKCGVQMKSIKSSKCYGYEYKYAICDICNKQIAENDMVFHCPQNKIANIHPHGFDICLKCRQKHIHRLRYFVAVIICPKMANNHIGKDATTLKLMFQKLGFHKIICLEGDEVTKKSVENALNSVLPKGGNENVNQFTAICYSGHGDVDEYGNYYFAINPYDENTWISANIIKNQCQAAKYGAVIDGFAKYFNQFWHRTYYRHNTLLLVNSCHSGASYGFVNSQIIADSFGTISALTLLLAPFGLTPAVLYGAANTLSNYLEKKAMECVMGCLRGEISMQCICACFGITEAQLFLIAKLAGIAVIVVIVLAVAIYKAIQKSKECESIYVIASCQTKQESNTVYGMSPFMKHCSDFFDIFLNPQQNKSTTQYLMDCPHQLFKYLEASYKVPDQRLDGASLNSIGQNVCASKRGFNKFAMCPILKQN